MLSRLEAGLNARGNSPSRTRFSTVRLFLKPSFPATSLGLRHCSTTGCFKSLRTLINSAGVNGKASRLIDGSRFLTAIKQRRRGCRDINVDVLQARHRLRDIGRVERAALRRAVLGVGGFERHYVTSCSTQLPNRLG